MKQSFSFSKNIYATELRVLRRSDNPFTFKIMILSKCNFFFLIFFFVFLAPYWKIGWW